MNDELAVMEASFVQYSNHLLRIADRRRGIHPQSMPPAEAGGEDWGLVAAPLVDL
jgi:hypothetical protein